MPRVHAVGRAQKDYPEHGIKKGEPYFWWQPRYGGKHYSKTRPRRSQLTSSDKLSTLYSSIESVEDVIADVRTKADAVPPAIDFATARAELAAALRAAATNVQDVASEYQDSASNLDRFPSKAEEMEEKASNCESLAEELIQAAEEIDEMCTSDGTSGAGGEDDDGATIDDLLERAEEALMAEDF